MQGFVLLMAGKYAIAIGIEIEKPIAIPIYIGLRGGGTKQANSKYLDSCNLVLSRLLGHRARKYAARRVLRCSNP